jgi:hypothetical protein
MGHSAPLMSPGAGLAADASSFTSRRKAPHQPALAAFAVFNAGCPRPLANAQPPKKPALFASPVVRSAIEH